LSIIYSCRLHCFITSLCIVFFIESMTCVHVYVVTNQNLFYWLKGNIRLHYIYVCTIIFKLEHWVLVNSLLSFCIYSLFYFNENRLSFFIAISLLFVFHLNVFYWCHSLFWRPYCEYGIYTYLICMLDNPFWSRRMCSSLLSVASLRWIFYI